jgi:CrcB protein
MLRQLLVVVLGSALGGGLRFLMATRVASWLPGRFPWGTLAVNVLGCFAIAVVLALVAGGASLSTQTRLFLTTGIMGGFTTYSAFNAELLGLVRDGHAGIAASYVVATLIVCAAAGLAGAAAGQALVR